MIKSISIWDVPLFLKVHSATRESELDFEKRNTHYPREEVNQGFKDYVSQQGVYLFDPLCLDIKTAYTFRGFFGGGLAIKKLGKSRSINLGLGGNDLHGLIEGQIILPNDLDNLDELIEQKRTLIEIQRSRGFVKLISEPFKAYFDRMPAKFIPTSIHSLHGIEKGYASSSGIEFREDYCNQSVLGAFSRAMNPLED